LRLLALNSGDLTPDPASQDGCGIAFLRFIKKFVVGIWCAPGYTALGESSIILMVFSIMFFEKKGVRLMYVSSIRQHILAGCILSLISYAAPAFSQNKAQHDREPFVTFEAPNAQATIPVAISNSLIVAGYYSGNMEPVAFVRDASGQVTTFVPAGCFRTFATGVNERGTVIGYCQPRGGFLRDTQGVITWLNCPGTDTARPYSINPAGVISGICGRHGFVRSLQGVFETFDPPGSRLTHGLSINESQTVAGIYYDANDVVHGFTRRSNGNFSVFELPGRPGSSVRPGAVPFSMNASEEITGTWVDANEISHGFFRSSNGNMTSFDFPGSISTSAFGINAAGVIAGHYVDENRVFHGFIRDGRGSFASFDPPRSTETIVAAINDRGVAAGYYGSDQARIEAAGFLRGVSNNEFQPGVYSITNSSGLYADGGFYAYGDPTVRLWVFVAGNPAQRWTFSQVSDGFTILNNATFQYANDGGGTLVQGPWGPGDAWTVTHMGNGYSVRNNRTGLYLTDPSVQNGAILLTPSPSVWEMSLPR
jgi:hypothetical protein